MDPRTPDQGPGGLSAGTGGRRAPQDLAVGAAPVDPGAAPPPRPPSPGSGRPDSVPPEDPDPPGRGTTRPGPGQAAAERPAEGVRDEAERAPGTSTDRLRYLEAATRRIARGIDLDETLRELCRAAIPTFADAVLVHLREPLPTGERPPAEPLVLRLHSIAQGPEDSVTAAPPGAADFVQLTVTGRFAELLLTGRPVFGDAPEIAPAVTELLDPVASIPASPSPGRRLIIAPLYGRRRLMGTVALLRGAERIAFTGDDLLVASQLATHTAFGVDKAALHGHEASLADALQLTMLPSSLPETTGVRLASRYLPAAETSQVGGDWYDAIPLPGNRVALVVGDVMGHSMTSAAIMGQLRTTVQTLAGLDLPPEEVLHHLDEQAQRLGSEHMATCLYAVYDPISQRLLVADAGHLPPVLLHPDGSGEVLRIPPGAPIGVGGVPFESVEMPAPTGATLLLYTDGLVESRGRDVWTGVELLCARLQAAAAVVASPPLEMLCDAVLTLLDQDARDDDVALLAARFDGFPPRNVAYWYLNPEPQTAGRARQLTRRALHRWGLDPLLDTTELLVSEVVTNAVRYANRPIALRLLRTDVLRCEVGDDSPQVPRMRRAQAGDEGGRGLFLVDRLAQRWGATRLSTGKVVWFEQPIPEEYRPNGRDAP
ncbi:SpoIIE family protein phosphatase [Streptomyces decoyicus]|uniref:SpoIIE family protein phosphatase n=1 Tax=Streptomyces decoyicus TaxID=249567 RepID=A0ABZ1FSE3_9ACTN|nr:SpoIIE family protein phosphatase [Streptomyces decoyicus]WSB73408.1 SpoIIE family protein phosphatase [Streptomyces decoyicus]